jgi:integrase
VQTKSGKSRKVPLTSELKGELVTHAHKRGFIFGQGKEGKPPRQEAISVAFGRLMRDIGLEGVTHHVLRHTGASAMVAAGISLRVVQDIGGWSTCGCSNVTHIRAARRCRARFASSPRT